MKIFTNDFELGSPLFFSKRGLRGVRRQLKGFF
jgi:hypothetical protein